MSENKKKKESIADLAKKAIKAKYAEEGKTLFHVSGTSLKGHGIGNFFAVFNPSGIEVYEFTTDKNLVLKHTLLWTDWSSVHIDHFALKSVFLFKGSGGEEQFAVSDGSGKQSEEVIRQHTQIEVSLHSRKWYQKILGFRSGKRWKMITASLVYLMLLFGIIGAFTGGGDAQQTVAEPSKQEESKPISKPEKEKDDEDKEIEKEIRLAQERLKKEKEQKKKEEQMKKDQEQKESKKEEKKKSEEKKQKEEENKAKEKKAEKEDNDKPKEDKKDKPKEDSKTKSDKKQTYTEFEEKMVRESYERLIEEQENAIIDIKPLNDDNYDVIHAFVVDEVKMLSDNEKQYLVDEWGKSISDRTKGYIPGVEIVHVYFKYADGSPLADPKLLGDGWKIKK